MAKIIGIDLGTTNSAVAVMEVGHRESEIFFLQTVERWCREWGIRSKVLNTPVQSIRK